MHVTAPDFLALDTIKWCHANNTAIIATWHSNLPEYTEHYRHLGLNLWLKPIMHSYFRSFYARVPHTYAPQQAVVELMRTAGYENASTRNELRVWGRGVNTSNFTPAKRSCRWRSSLGIADTDVVLLWVGRCVPEKSPQVWISVMRALQQMYSHVRGVVVGRGAFYDEMVAIPGVTGLGWLNVDQLSAAYANADVLLFPSRVETFGNVTLEAMASGCPCVVDAECSGHLIKDGANGFAVVTGAPGAKEDASAYLDAVKALVENDELRRTFSEANREIAERVYGLEAVNARMIDNYREAIAESRVESGRRKFSLHETPAMVLWSYIAIFFAALTCILMTPEKGLFKNNARGLRLLMVVKGIKLAILGALLVLLDSFVHLTAVVQHFQAAAKLV